MTNADFGSVVLTLGAIALGFLWDHRGSIATLIGLLLLIGILNNLLAIAVELERIVEVLKERLPKLPEDDR
jgi:hypothetical protein